MFKDAIGEQLGHAIGKQIDDPAGILWQFAKGYTLDSDATEQLEQALDYVYKLHRQLASKDET